MSRCRACDAPLNWVDFRMKQGDNDQFEEDFCGVCRGVVNTIDDPEEKTYRFEELRCGAVMPKSSEY